jgi:hypothetical protein
LKSESSAENIVSAQFLMLQVEVVLKAYWFTGQIWTLDNWALQYRGQVLFLDFSIRSVNSPYQGS